VIVTLPIQFTCDYSYITEFYVTHLDGSSPVVLGYNWLRTHNLEINWREGALNISPKKLTNTLGPRKEAINNKARSIHKLQA